jgi:hypothetical protein
MLELTTVVWYPISSSHDDVCVFSSVAMFWNLRSDVFDDWSNNQEKQLSSSVRYIKVQTLIYFQNVVYVNWGWAEMCLVSEADRPYTEG